MQITKEEFPKLVKEAFAELPENTVHLPEENVDIPVLEEPLTGFADADDPLFEQYKDPAVIGENFKTPKEWMPEAQTVAGLYHESGTGDERGRRGSSFFRRLVQPACAFRYYFKSTCPPISSAISCQWAILFESSVRLSSSSRKAMSVQSISFKAWKNSGNFGNGTEIMRRPAG